jgi:hypothetical protein
MGNLLYELFTAPTGDRNGRDFAHDLEFAIVEMKATLGG